DRRPLNRSRRAQRYGIGAGSAQRCGYGDRVAANDAGAAALLRATFRDIQVGPREGLSAAIRLLILREPAQRVEAEPVDTSSRVGHAGKQSPSIRAELDCVASRIGNRREIAVGVDSQLCLLTERSGNC